MKDRNTISSIAVLGALATLSSSNIQASDLKSVEFENWRAIMAQNPGPAAGCFHASFPSYEWESIPCSGAKPHARPPRVRSQQPLKQDVGNGNDYVAQANGLIRYAGGKFDASGITSETGEDVLGYGFAIVGPNEYTLQLNTNANNTTAACANHPNCTVWQQFVYETDYPTDGSDLQNHSGQAALYIQYWLLDWGSAACPSVEWNQSGYDCYMNSSQIMLDNFPIEDLGEMSMGTSVAAGYNDVLWLYHGTDAYQLRNLDKVLDIANAWTEAEFNVLGNAGLSQAVFNRGTSIKVTLSLADGSMLAPRCVLGQGTTGETNNLNLSSCQASVAANPQIQFGESNIRLQPTIPVLKTTSTSPLLR